MSTTIDQKAYLQKYLSGPSKDKKKKKKKVVKGKGIKIIDDDIDLTKLRPLEGDELDILDEGEDAPQIAGIVDERPEELRKIEQFQTSSKWRVINQDDGFNSNIQIQEIKRDIKETTKENEVIFGKMYSDSEDEAQKENNDSDLSPPRNNKTKLNDSDMSPPRKKDKTEKKDNKDTKYDSDQSPPRQRESREKKRRKPSRWGQDVDNKESRQSLDLDISPQRSSKKSLKQERSSSDQSPPRKSAKVSPERRKRYDSDISPPRKERNKTDSVGKDKRSPNAQGYEKKGQRDQSPYRRDRDRYNDNYKRKYDDDASRNRRKDDGNKNYSVNRDRAFNTGSPPRNKQKKETRTKDSDSDQSPPRRNQNRNTDRNISQNSDSDLSPPRRKDKYEKDRRYKPQNSDSDLSPPRRNHKPNDRYRDTLEKDKRNRQNSDSPPPSNKKMAKTLEGKKAGLQNARQLREENDEFRRKEDEVFKGMADEVSGRNAHVVARRSKRETSEERQKQREKAERQKVIDEKYKKWSKGIKQVEAQQERLQDFIHEANKPLARHKDDKDLERSLKQIERAGDPMLQYIRERKRERGELAPEKPMYKGNFPPNRFNIRPGYRWDGVDRSNGYEKKYFDQQSKRKALEEEAYKWSTEDL